MIPPPCPDSLFETDEIDIFRLQERATLHATYTSRQAHSYFFHSSVPDVIGSFILHGA